MLYFEQTPQTLFDADFEGLASNAEVYIFNQDDSQVIIDIYIYDYIKLDSK